MLILTGERGSGKTTELLKRLKDHPDALVIVQTFQQKKDFEGELEQRSLLNRVFTFQDWMEGRARGIYYSHIFVDNLDLILSSIFHTGNIVVTATAAHSRLDQALLELKRYGGITSCE